MSLPSFAPQYPSQTFRTKKRQFWAAFRSISAILPHFWDETMHCWSEHGTFWGVRFKVNGPDGPNFTTVHFHPIGPSTLMSKNRPVWALSRISEPPTSANRPLWALLDRPLSNMTVYFRLDPFWGSHRAFLGVKRHEIDINRKNYS